MLSNVTSAERYEPGLGSQAGFAYVTIRADILRGLHMPNKKLKVHELALQLGISPGAVREALFRLVSEHLVETREQRGFAVTPVSVADLKELTDLRCEIETIACRRSVERGGIEWEGGLVAAEYRLRATSAGLTDDGPVSLEFLGAHAAFHEALTAAAGNTRLLSMRSQLFEQYQRFRAFFAKFAGRRHFAADHEQLFKFAMARDADALVEEMVDHLSQATRRIIQAIEKK
jgi:GntR family transcriptional regulator, carbon starvation induced regulator